MIKKHILFIITKSEIGGAQKFVADQVRLLSQESNNVFIATNESGWLTNTCNSYTDNNLIDRGIESKLSVNYLLKLYSFLKNQKIDIVVCNSANGGLYGRLAAFLVNKKSIYISHGWSSIYSGGRFAFLFNKIEYLLSLISSYVVCVSKSDYDKAVSVIGINSRKLKQIYNGIVPNNNTIIKKYDTHKILSVGRLAAPKRFDILMRAMKYLPDYELEIVGDGPNRKKLEGIITNEDIKNVVLRGEISNFEIDNSYVVFALISDSEGLPMSAIEAMAKGLPLVLSDVGGCGELILDNGFVTENNPISIASAITECMSKREYCGDKSIEHFNRNFDLRNTILDYASLYDEIMK